MFLWTWRRDKISYHGSVHFKHFWYSLKKENLEKSNINTNYTISGAIYVNFQQFSVDANFIPCENDF